MTVNARTITDEEFFYGHKACPGCGPALLLRGGAALRWRRCPPAA